MLVSIFFESTWMLAVFWAAVQFGLVAIWSWRRSAGWARALWGGFIAAPLLFISSRLVVTDREQLISTCKELAGMVESASLEGIAAHLSEDFIADGKDREDFIRRLEKTLARYHVWGVELWSFQVTFRDEDSAIVTFQAGAHVSSPDLIHDWFASRWRLSFRRGKSAWMLSEVQGLSRRGI